MDPSADIDTMVNIEPNQEHISNGIAEMDMEHTRKLKTVSENNDKSLLLSGSPYDMTAKEFTTPKKNNSSLSGTMEPSTNPIIAKLLQDSKQKHNI